MVGVRVEPEYNSESTKRYLKSNTMCITWTIFNIFSLGKQGVKFKNIFFLWDRGLILRAPERDRRFFSFDFYGGT